MMARPTACGPGGSGENDLLLRLFGLPGLGLLVASQAGVGSQAPDLATSYLKAGVRSSAQARHELLGAAG